MMHPTRRAVLTWVTCCATRKCAWDCGAVVVCRVAWCGIIVVSVSMKGKSKMINFNAYVIELEVDNSYEVCIENIFKGIVTDNGLIDDSVTTFETALSTVMTTLKPSGVCLRRAVVVVNMLFRLIMVIDIK